MKKNLIIPIVATAALLFTSTGSISADAATPNQQVEKKVYVYQYGNVNTDQINSILQKYLKGFQVNWNTVKNPNVVQKPAENTNTNTAKEPVKPATKPAPAQQQQKPETTTTATKPVQQQQKPAASTKPTETATTSQVSAFEQKVVELTNQERAKQGLPALTLDTELSKVARTKSQDMLNKGYFSHTSPTYGSPFDMMKQFGISYRSAGENIAMGQSSPEEVVKAWMNSEGHRANILNSSYTHIGVGHVANGNYWTQMFIGK